MELELTKVELKKEITSAEARSKYLVSILEQKILLLEVLFLEEKIKIPRGF